MRLVAFELSVSDHPASAFKLSQPMVANSGEGGFCS